MVADSPISPAAAGDFGKLLVGMIDGGANKIVMDCRDLQYVSRSGLGAFIQGGKKLGASGKLVFAALNSHIQDVFEMTGIANLFTICSSKEDALKKLEAKGALPPLLGGHRSDGERNFRAFPHHKGRHRARAGNRHLSP